MSYNERPGKILNLSRFVFTDNQVEELEDISFASTLLTKFNAEPSFGDMARRSKGVMGIVKSEGYTMAIVDCPCFMVQPLLDCFKECGLTALFPYYDSVNKRTVVLDENGNPIYRSR